MATQLAAQHSTPDTGVGAIDCDIHPQLPDLETLLAHLPERWAAHMREGAFGPRGFPGTTYPRQFRHASRVDAWPPGGGPPASDLDFLRSHHLDRWGFAHGVLNPMDGAVLPRDTRLGAAICTAVNDWQLTWVEAEPRLKASIVVQWEDGESAVAEIERRAGDARWAQVLIYSRSSEPLGRPRYRRMFEAAAAAGLPVGIHFGLAGGGPVTGHGMPSFYVEDHMNMSMSFQEQLISLVCEGTFSALPDLRVVLIEGGLGWLAPLLWRLDRSWRLLRAEVPHLDELPSTVVRRQLWLTTQPIEEPPRDADFVEMLEQADMDGHVMFSTDYPHWDFDSPLHALPQALGADLRRRIFFDNARDLYGF